MTAARAALLGGAFGGMSGGIIGAGIAQFFAGPRAHGLLWLAAFIGAISLGILTALVIRNSVCKPKSPDLPAGRSLP